MNLKKYVVQNKEKIVFLLTLFSIGIISGIIFFITQSAPLKEECLKSLLSFKESINTNTLNLFYYHFIAITCVFFLNWTGIGIIANIFYFFYEGCSLGFSISMFAFAFKIKGFFFALTFNLLTKSIFLTLILIELLIGLNVVKKIMKMIIKKKEEIKYQFLRKHLVIFGLIIIAELFNLGLIYFGFKHIIKGLFFLI